MNFCSQQHHPRFAYLSMVVLLVITLSGCNLVDDTSSNTDQETTNQDDTSQQNQDDTSQQNQDDTSQQNQDDTAQQNQDEEAQQNQDDSTQQNQDDSTQQNQDDTSASGNHLPQAMIIAPATSTSGQTVTLNGAGSTDPDNDELSYKWAQTVGPEIEIPNGSSSNLTFIAPAVSQATKLTFQLTVDDGELSHTATASIQILPVQEDTSQDNSQEQDTDTNQQEEQDTNTSQETDTGAGLQWTNVPFGMAVFSKYDVEGTTGGGDGEVVTATTKSELADYAGRSEPLYIIVKGTLTGGGAISINSNKTIIGAGSGAVLDKIELNTSGSNIIIRNLTIKDGGRDAICTRGAHHVWIDHLDLSNCGDGLLDIVKMSDLITVSWTRFHNHDKNMLINNGTSQPQDDPFMNTTVHHNWFDGTNQRSPRAAYGDIHIFNNLYNNNGSYCIGLHSRCMVLSEHNYFKDTNNPIHQMYRDDPASIHHGFCEDVGSIFDNTSGDKDVEEITVNFREDYYMYDFALDPAEDVPSIVMDNVGPGEKWSQLGPLPIPGQGAIKVSTSPTLRWTRGQSATSYQVSFGTTNPPPSAETTSEQTFSPGSLNSSTVYYWRVDQVKSDGGIIKGDVWRFKTQ